MRSVPENDQFPRLQILEVLKPYHVSKAIFESLLEFINHLPKFNSFATIAGNLCYILKTLRIVIAESQITDNKLPNNINGWISCCETITAHLDDIELQQPGFCSKGHSPYSPPYRDYFETHPLAIALWCSVQNEELHSRYVQLQAQLCLSFHLLQVQSAKKRKYTASAKIKACLAVRKLSRPEFRAYLWKLPERPLSMKAYRRALKQFDDDKDIHPLLVLIDYALKEKAVRERTGKMAGRAVRGAFNLNQQVISFGTEEAGDAEKMTVLKVTTGNKTEIARRKNTLCNPDEFHSSRQFAIQERAGKDPSGGLSERQQHMMSRGVSSALAMHNQRLPGDWERLTAYEIETLLQGLKKLVDSPSSIMGIPSAELAAFLSICFWMARPPETARDATLVPDAANCKTELGILWYPDPKSEKTPRIGCGGWVVKPRVAKLHSVPAKILELQAELVLSGRYTLSIPMHAAFTMDKHLSLFQVRFHPVRIFDHEVTKYEQAANEFMRTLRSRTGGRHSLKRVAKHMHNYIAQLPGSDITTAMSISGNNDPLGAVPLHYTANSIEHLRKIYSDACCTVLSDTDLDKLSAQPQKTSAYHVGSRFVPKPDTVKELVSNLRSRLKSAREEVEKDPVLIHNQITVYTVTMLGFATGYRAVRDPLLQEAEIDRESGFAVISDKDDESFYNSRIVWLPDICLKQLDLYDKHISELQHWLFDHNLQLFFKSREKITTGRRADRENPALFLLKQKSDDLPVQPKLLKQLLARTSYNLPVNSNRHYLRTNLLKSGCPLEVVSAFLGHWERGEEPWGRYSGLSPMVYRDVLKEYLVSLMDKAEWKTESGFERR